MVLVIKFSILEIVLLRETVVKWLIAKFNNRNARGQNRDWNLRNALETILIALYLP